MGAAIDRTIPARLLPDPHAVLDFGQHRATNRAVGAHVLPNDTLRRRWSKPGRLRLAQAAQRQRSEYGQTAGSKAGATQEGSPINTTTGMTAYSRSKGAATGLTFAFLD
jgi:hypothetical protein